MSTLSSPESTNTAPSTVELIENDPLERGRSDYFGWWYRIAAPQVPPTTATLKQRDAYRRGKLINAMCKFPYATT